MNDIAPTHVKEGTVTMDAGEMRCDSAAAPEPLDVACARAPIGLLAELTHRCPLQCPYCSNPLDLERANTELTTAEWQKVMREAAQLGILQIHLSGGEPTVRRDLEDIIKTAADAGLYTNLITAAVLLTRERLVKLKEAGLDHVQISIQDVDTASENADRIAGYKGGSDKKKIVAGWVRELGMPLTINAPIHRHNIKNVEAIIDYAVALGAGRVEIAHVQYYAWALKNRARADADARGLHGGGQDHREGARASEGRHRHRHGRPRLLRQVPQALHGRLGPRHHQRDAAGARASLPCRGIDQGPRVRQRARQAAGRHLAQRLRRSRSTAAPSWMKEPCRTCPRREVDYGGCRCQAFALTGDAANTDPACSLSPMHAEWAKVAEVESHVASPEFIYRRPGGASPKPAREKIPAPTEA